MGPYANTMHSSKSDGPVQIIMELGKPDIEIPGMEWDPEPSNAIEAVRQLREDESFMAMEVDLPWEMGDTSPPSSTVVVLDTNILLRYLPLLRTFVKLVERCQENGSNAVQVLLPHVVLRELDGLKNSTKVARKSLLAKEGSPSARELAPDNREASIGSLSRAASNWLLDVISTPGGSFANKPRIVRGQRKDEGYTGTREANADDEIVQIAVYFQETLGSEGRVVLISDDNNLCLKARIEHVDTLSLDDTVSPEILLKRVNPALFTTATSHIATRSHVHSVPPSTSPTRRGCMNDPSPVTRIPPVSNIKEVDILFPRMDAEFEPITPPPFVKPPPPTLRLVRTQQDVIANACDSLTYLLAMNLYQHIFNFLQIHSRGEYEEWMNELGDWRLWGAPEVVRTVHRWWVNAGVKDVCRIGLEKAEEERRSSGVLEGALPGFIDAPKPSPSRWASSEPLLSPRHPQLSAVKSLQESLTDNRSIEHSLKALYSSLPSVLLSTTATDDSISQWSAPRLEVFLEIISRLLLALLGGFLRCSVVGEIGSIVSKWAEELKSLGVLVDPKYI